MAQAYPTSPTAITATSYYNAADQLTGLIDAAHGTAFWVFGYGRDADGRVSSALDPLTGYHSYGSDALNRLGSDQATAPYTGTSGWSYDAANDPITLSYSTTYVLTDTLGYDAASELHSLQLRVNGALTHSYEYTNTATGGRAAVGDLLSPAMASYGWDQADRLITATNGITTSSYVYNGDGLRMSKVVSGTAEAYVWDTAEGLPLLLEDGGTRYIIGPDGLPLESVSGSSTVLYYLHDQLGSTRGLIDANGTGVASYSYTPYGTVSLHTGAVATPYQYAGQYTDAETGFQYLQARYYDPATSQFLSPDPLAMQTQQPYVYAADDPLNGSDPSGLDCSLWALVTGGCRLPTLQEAQATWTNEVRPETYAAAVSTAGFFDSVSGGLYSKVAGLFGATVPQCSADYQQGQVAGLPYNLLLAAVSGGGDVEADAALLAGVGWAERGSGLAADATPGVEATADVAQGVQDAADTISLFSRAEEPLSGGSRSGLTAFGQSIIEKLRAMGVETRYATGADEERFMEANQAKGVTNFWGNSPQDTQVLLHSSANDATVYEEYLHVLEGYGRGWVSPDSVAALAEEVSVKRQVLAMADALGMTSVERAETETTIEGYLRALGDRGISLP